MAQTAEQLLAFEQRILSLEGRVQILELRLDVSWPPLHAISFSILSKASTSLLFWATVFGRRPLLAELGRWEREVDWLKRKNTFTSLEAAAAKIKTETLEAEAGWHTQSSNSAERSRFVTTEKSVSALSPELSALGSAPTFPANMFVPAGLLTYLRTQVGFCIQCTMSAISNNVSTVHHHHKR